MILLGLIIWYNMRRKRTTSNMTVYETTTNTPTDAAFERETTITLSDGDTLVRIWSARRKDITRMRKKPEIFTEIRA